MGWRRVWSHRGLLCENRGVGRELDVLTRGYRDGARPLRRGLIVRWSGPVRICGEGKGGKSTDVAGAVQFRMGLIVGRRGVRVPSAVEGRGIRAPVTLAQESNPMRIRFTLKSGIAAMALAVTSISSAPAMAGDPAPGPVDPAPGARIVANAVENIRSAAREACADIQTAARNTVEHIARLAQRGADDEVIAEAARAGSQRISARARAAAAQIGAIRDRAVTLLTANGGSREQIARVNGAAASAVDDVDGCRTAALRRIHAALARATNGPR